MEGILKRYLYLVSFLCGGAIMGIELLGSRVLAPVYGYSIYVWGSLLGIVMIALSIGYIIGGKLADKKPKPEIMFKIILISGFFTAIIPFISIPVMDLALKLGVIGGTILSAGAILCIPVLLLAFVSPFIIKLLAKADTIGDTAGKIYGVSTIGSIAGTFITAFYMIPEIGTSTSVMIFSALLVGTGTMGLAIKKKLLEKNNIMIYVVCGLVLFSVVNIIPAHADPEKIYETESAYSYLSVYETEKMIAVKINTQNNFQSVIIKNSSITNMYWDYINIGPIINDAKSALFLGVGGGTSILQFREFFDMEKIVGVDIDAEMLDIAREYFGVQEDEVVKLAAEDGRMYLRGHPDEIYDFALIDAYGDGSSLPFYMVTQEFFREVRNHLSDNGVLMLNVVSVDQRKDLVDPIMKTLSTIYPSVFAIQLKNNHVVIATSEKMSLDDVLGKIGEYKKNNEDIPFIDSLENTELVIVEFKGNDEKIYTDDLTDAEKMIFKVWYGL